MGAKMRHPVTKIVTYGEPIHFASELRGPKNFW